MAYPDHGIGPAAVHDDLASPVADSVARPIVAARLRPVAGESPTAEPPWLSRLAHGEPGLSRVAALGQTAQALMRAGRTSECFAVLDEQRAAAGTDQTALVWALTVSCAVRGVLGQLARSRADLAQARRTCLYAAPLLAQPYWQFADIVYNWLSGDWNAARADASSLNASQVAPVTPVLAGVILALRTEMLRGIGMLRESRMVAERLPAEAPAEMAAWAQAGLNVDDGRGADAMRLLADVCDAGKRSVNRASLPLVLHRMAETAFSAGDRDATARAAAGLADLDQAAPLTEIVTGIAQAYAACDPRPARHAQQRAKAEGAWALTAEALTARGRTGEDPAKTLAAAHAAWERIGAPARARAVAAAMRDAGLPAPSAGFQWARHVPAKEPPALTERERSVALLVHQGRTNQQIAHALNISIKTVEAYLTRLYRKTSCSSRVELAVAVTEHRLHLGGEDG